MAIKTKDQCRIDEVRYLINDLEKGIKNRGGSFTKVKVQQMRINRTFLKAELKQLEAGE